MGQYAYNDRNTRLSALHRAGGTRNPQHAYLEDMGTIGILNNFRRQVLAGKTVSDCLSAWQKKNDYGYFQTRLDDNFHFNSVKDLAAARLATAQNFMDSLTAELSLEDLQQLIESPPLSSTL